MKYKGIDVSSYQGTIDWSKASAAGTEFAVLKVVRKDMQPDKQFEANWNGCVKAGVPVQGVYQYSYATEVEAAKRDAHAVLEILGGRKPMVWLDVEDKVQQGIGDKLIDIINEYGAIIKSAGCEFGVYTGIFFYDSFIKPYADKIQCPFWIARYPVSAAMDIRSSLLDDKRPAIAHDMYGWQYSSKGVVPGISGNVDLNELYIAIGAENETLAPAPEVTLHKVGEEVIVSSYYNSSTASMKEAIIKNAAGTITKIKTGAQNPYFISKAGEPIGWCNDGDIRSSGNSLQVGTKKKVYVVKNGDTLSGIAEKYGISMAQLQSLNGIKNVNKIYVGENIRIE